MAAACATLAMHGRRHRAGADRRAHTNDNLSPAIAATDTNHTSSLHTPLILTAPLLVNQLEAFSSPTKPNSRYL
ncbi:hypothetical protein HaLaN_14654 [Haematococcus lacustris]|uniref:Uncharacterized protein n=1 Tax=Haematococcus lacustris TaxID=44745 RepID=A0A699ZEY0_HAELA|nr:hypothetical protein HaLaN_14654 [Haematococcus lacustris]